MGSKMNEPGSMRALEELGRVRLSPSFFMRDFLHSEIASFYGMPNIPDDPGLAVEAGRRLCEVLLEPISDAFGGISIRSAYRSCAVNEFGNRNDLNCASNEKNFGHHIWDRRDADGCMGATACVVVRSFADHYARGADWRSLAWWIHDHLPYSTMCFFPKLAAFNIQWHERPQRRIDSYIAPKGCLTKPGMAGHDGDHASSYAELPMLAAAVVV